MWTTLDVSVGTVGGDMPGVNGICKQKVSPFAWNFELLLRSGVAVRNFPPPSPAWRELPAGRRKTQAISQT